MLKERAVAAAGRIGMDNIALPIIYNCLVAIRFEIGVGEPYRYCRLNNDYVRAALQRAYTIYQNAPGTFDTLLWIIHPYGKNTEEKLLDRFCRIISLPLPQERYSETLPPNEERDDPVEEVRCYWDLQVHTANIEKLFKEIVKADFGGFRELTSSVFLFDTDLNLLFYLYDDRGLDVAAASRETIAPLYRSFCKWILEYDRECIDRTFTGSN